MLYSVGIRVKEDAGFAIAERIEDKSELVVIVDLLAAHHVGANLIRFRVETKTNDVEILVGIAEIDFGFLRNGRTVFWIALQEAAYFEHLPGDGG